MEAVISALKFNSIFIIVGCVSLFLAIRGKKYDACFFIGVIIQAALFYFGDEMTTAVDITVFLVLAAIFYLGGQQLFSHSPKGKDAEKK